MEIKIIENQFEATQIIARGVYVLLKYGVHYNAIDSSTPLLIRHCNLWQRVLRMNSLPFHRIAVREA